MTEASNKPSCFMPWHALTITGLGHAKPCCQSKSTYGNLHEDVGLTDIIADDKFKTLRADLLAGKKPANCNSCWVREDGIKESRRTWFQEKFMDKYPAQDPERVYGVDDEFQFLQLDINFSNFCNLRCRMCGSWGSHRWIEEEKFLLQKDARLQRESNPERLQLREITLEKIEELIPHLKQIRRIDFKGGEPMLAKPHTKFLELLIENGYAHKIELVYTTNGTVFNEKIARLLPQFKNVLIVVSIEGTGPLYQYIRGGSFDLDQVVENIKKYEALGNINVAFNVATQIYNVLHLRELWTFLQSLNSQRISAKDAFKYTMVNSPAYLSPYILPPALNLLAREKIADIPELAHIYEGLEKAVFKEELWSQFCSFTEGLDHTRKESLSAVIPEMLSFWRSQSKPALFSEAVSSGNT